ncbi:MAG: winged helix-turn-helix domain-containing protein [Acidimicrobiaceae bacterium]|nr:winged helix-turn-helix domain-containing protein [Acidimicrobiaceae bacterium]
MKQPGVGSRDRKSDKLDWKAAVVSVLSSGDSLTVGEIADRIYTTRLSEALARRGLLGSNAHESIRVAITQANAEGTTITKWRDPHDTAIRYALGNREPENRAQAPATSTRQPGPAVSRRRRAPGSPRTLLDAAEMVLKHHADRQPLHIREVVSLAVEHGYWSTGGQTPTNTLSARVGSEIKQRQADGQRQRFTRPQRGYLGLAVWEISDPAQVAEAEVSEAAYESSSGMDGEGALEAVDDASAESEELRPHTDSMETTAAATAENPGSERQPAIGVDGLSDPRIADALAEFLTRLESRDFIRCLTAYLAAIGAEDLTFGGGAGCFDISAQGFLVAGGLFRRPLSVHVSCSIDHQVTRSDIAVCRGQAGTFDLALVIALGGFSPEARAEVQRAGTLPLEALDRTEFAQALFDLGIGVRVEQVEAYEVGHYF